MNDTMRRCTAALLAFALVLVSPGLPAYAAAGKNTPGKTPVRVSFTPVPPASRQTPSVPGSTVRPETIPGAGKIEPAKIPAAAGAPVVPGAKILLSGARDASLPLAGAKIALPVPAIAAARGGVTLTEAQLAALAADSFSDRPTLGYHFVALSNHFRNKPVEEVPSAPAVPAQPLGFDLTGRGAVDIGLLKPAAPQGFAPEISSENAPEPAPAPAPESGKEAEPKLPGRSDGIFSGIFSIGRTALLFIAALVVAQVGIESQGAALPALMEAKFGDFTMATELTITSMVAGFFGRMVAPKIIEKFGLKKTFIGTLALRTVAIGTVVALLYFNAMSIPLLFGLFAINGFLSGISITAEMSIPPAIVGQNPDKLENFWAIEQTAVEVIGIAGPILTGVLLKSVGFMPLMLAFPVTFIAAIVMLWFFLRLPAKLDMLDKSDKAGAKAKKRSIGNGAKVVWGNPILKYSFLAYTAFMMMNPFLYGILASAYGMLVAAGVPEVAAGAYGLITGLYSAGGLIAGGLMIWESRKLKKLMNPPPGSGLTALKQDTVDERLRLSMFKWMKWGTFALILIGSFCIPAGLILGPLTLPALALIPFGIAQVASSLKLRSYFQSKAPVEDMADAMGFLGAVSLAISTVGLLGLKFMFKGVSLFGFKLFPAFTGLAGLTPFIVVAVLMIPLAILKLRLTAKLRQASEPPQPPAAK